MKDKIGEFIKQVDGLGGAIEAAHIQWLSPKADDHIREVYEHLHAIMGLMDNCSLIAAQIAKDANNMTKE